MNRKKLYVTLPHTWPSPAQKVHRIQGPSAHRPPSDKVSCLSNIYRIKIFHLDQHNNLTPKDTKPSNLPIHLRGHHKDCCQATCQHLDHKSDSTGIKAGEAVKASLEAVLNVAPPSLQPARLPASQAPTCPNLPPTILCSKVVFTSTTRYGGYLFSEQRKNYSLVFLYKLLPAQTYLPPFLAEHCSKVVFNSIKRFSAYLQCSTGTRTRPATQYFFGSRPDPIQF